MKTFFKIVKLNLFHFLSEPLMELFCRPQHVLEDHHQCSETRISLSLRLWRVELLGDKGAMAPVSYLMVASKGQMENQTGCDRVQTQGCANQETLLLAESFLRYHPASGVQAIRA